MKWVREIWGIWTFTEEQIFPKRENTFEEHYLSHVKGHKVNTIIKEGQNMKS